jgi:hypothetical protein
MLAGITVAGLGAVAARSGVRARATVRPDHPRLLLDQPTRERLKGIQTGDNAIWQALKARADLLATFTVLEYKFDTRTDEPENTIFYDYQGEGWLQATMNLGLAAHMSGDPAYVAKLMEIADELLRAQTDPYNQPPDGILPLQVDSFYPSRNVGPVVGIIFDWCYDALGDDRKAKLVDLMNQYFDDLRANGYERNDHASGNYFFGHVLAAAAMGYASFGDNPRAQEMIAWARIRFDGTPSSLVAEDNVPEDNVVQLFDGGYKPAIARFDNGPAITTAPSLGGFPVQGWAYGSETFSRLVDYLLMVRTATGEDLLTPNLSWFSQILRAEKSSLLPNRFIIDPVGDWGGDQGAVILRQLPARLAYVLAGSEDGPGAQHFAFEEIAESTIPGIEVFPLSEWEAMLYADPTRPSSALTLPPFYTGLSPVSPGGGATNGARPYFVMRSNWETDATWAAINMGNAFYDDHQHADSGSLVIARGSDFLLVDASNWKGEAGSSGIVGSSTEADNASSANTLWFDDFGEFQNLWVAPDGERERQTLYAGGQAQYGKDDIAAAEMTAAYSFIRADLSTAYNRSSDPADQIGRRLEHFYRSFVYLRSADLFVVYDQVAAKPSGNARGEYPKHIRWHLPNQPTLTGTQAAVEQGDSRLQIDTLLPANAVLKSVDESNNPDPCDGTDNACVPYEAWQSASGTWRIEVSDPANALELPFLTVLQPGASSRPPMSSRLLAAADSVMIGAQVSVDGQGTSIVLFNNGAGQVPEPVTSASYKLAGSDPATHLLCGMAPGAAYAVDVKGSTVTVSREESGDLTASAGGVLAFSTPI